MKPRTRPLAVALLCLFPALWSATALASLPRARPGFPVVVVPSPFGADAATLVRNAGGYAVGPVSRGMLQLAHAQEPGFIERLGNGGALMILDANGLAAYLCGANV